jgi:antitoxin (DNA-binding transcriptional repressor) of toxin-antitoxin stability system
MEKTTISVTDASRNFADCVNRAHYQKMTFVLLKNGLPVAQLVPSDEKSCKGRDLAGVLAKTKLTDEESKAWRRDLRSGRNILKAPVNKWR